MMMGIDDFGHAAFLCPSERTCETIAAVERGLASPDTLSDTRRAVAADLFYRPGGATARAIRGLYEAIDLEPAPAVVTEEVACRS